MNAQKTFDLIAGRLASKSEALGRFAETGYSFEEWINWESFDAIQSAKMEVFPKPAYPNGRGLADLKVVEGSEELYVETAVCTESTCSKWKHKINADSEKLRALGRLHTLQIVVLVCGDINASTWPGFLKAFGWDDRPSHSLEKAIPGAYKGAGCLRIRGWVDWR